MVVMSKQKPEFLAAAEKTPEHEIEVKEFDEKATSVVGQAATLYNFGYTAKEVIEKFQLFCYNYSTLGDAIYALLKRDKLLKKKYRFITTPVTYQMLARPTLQDRPSAVRSAMLAMHKYTKDGRYKSVADAIEELLFGPEAKKMASVGMNTTMHGDETSSGFQYTMLSDVEQEALCKIADVVFVRLSTMENEKTRRSKKPTTSKKSNSPSGKVHTSPSSKSDNFVAAQSKQYSLQRDPDYSPTGQKQLVWQKTMKVKSESDDSGTSPRDVTHLHNPFVEPFILPPDIEMLTPLKRLISGYEVPDVTTSKIKEAVLQYNENSDKTLFMLNCFDLLPNNIAMFYSGTDSISDFYFNTPSYDENEMDTT
ncbi:uncharacterized protein LOC143462587 [Clavelina lepadiformis]|uniref:Uncharacterized protein n=1 Tax=Clavelina lepadiformis TaxID=159417 RepID=A0ABP0GKV8_CLALP